MILCCGEALIDMLPVDLSNGGVAYEPKKGGAVFNTSVALARLGQEAGFLCGLSTDLFGRQLADQLDHEGVNTGLCPRPALPTTLAFVALEEGKAEYTFYDENSAMRMLKAEDIGPLPASCSALFFGGISLCNMPACDAYAELCNRYSDDRLIMIDPNVRPGFVSDWPAYRARIRAMIAQADIVKVSDDDLGWITSGATLEGQLSELLGLGPAFVILTKGAEGADMLRQNGARLTAPAPKVDIVDTVGAGDTFNAGFLAALQMRGSLTKADLATTSDDDIIAALTFANQAAAISVTRPGADPPLLHEVRAKMRE
ncbi:MAG: carbohydrate kinase [Paracoccaceae bacterium]